MRKYFLLFLVLLTIPVAMAGTYGQAVYSLGEYGIGAGVLNASLMTITANTNVTKGAFFNYTSNVTCSEGNCGNVYGWLDPISTINDGLPLDKEGYNNTITVLLFLIAILVLFFVAVRHRLKSFKTSDHVFMAIFILLIVYSLLTVAGLNLTGFASGNLVSTTEGATPFYTLQSNPINCSILSNASNGTATCTTSWLVNATGNDSTTYTFFAFYNSSESGITTINTTLINITILSPDTTPPILHEVSVNTSTGRPGDRFTISINTSDARSAINTTLAIIKYEKNSSHFQLATTLNGGVYTATWNSTNYPNGTYIIGAQVNDSLGNQRTATTEKIITISSATTTTLSNTSINISAGTPTIFNTTGNVLISILPVVNVSNTSILVATYDSNTENNTPVSALSINKTIHIVVDNTTNANIGSAFINVTYNDTIVTSIGVDESTLRLYKFNTTTNNWTALANTGVNTTNNIVWANVTSFSIYGIFGNTTSSDESGSSRRGGSSAAQSPPTVTISTLKVVGDSVTRTLTTPGEKITLTLLPRSLGDHVIEYSSANVNEQSITLIITSNTKTIILGVGKTEKVDVNDDGIYDLAFTLQSFTSASQLDLKIEVLSGVRILEAKVETPSPAPTTTMKAEESTVGIKTEDSLPAEQESQISGDSNLYGAAIGKTVPGNSWLIIGAFLLLILISVGLWLLKRKGKK